MLAYLTNSTVSTEGSDKKRYKCKDTSYFYMLFRKNTLRVFSVTSLKPAITFNLSKKD